MKTLLLCLLFPVSCLCCQNCVNEIVEKNKEALNEIMKYEAHMTPYDCCLFYYYAGKAESLTEAIKIMKNNH